MSGQEAVAVFGGVETKVICIRYADRVFLTITQLPTFGTLISCKADRYPDGSEFYNCNTMLGIRDKDELELLARRLAEMVSRQTGLDLLLAVGLKPDALTMEVVREIVQYFEAAKIWMPEVGSESAGAELTPAQAGVLGMSSEEVASRRAMAAGFKSTVRAGKGT